MTAHGRRTRPLARLLHPSAPRGIAGPTRHAGAQRGPHLPGRDLLGGGERRARRRCSRDGARATPTRRLGHPTATILADAITTLEGGEAGLTFDSGMGAISGTLSAHLGQGDHVVVTRAVYGSTRALITTVLARFGITATFVDPTDLPAVEAAITQATRVLYLETISNPTLVVADLAALAALGHRHGLTVVVDEHVRLALPLPAARARRGPRDRVVHEVAGRALGRPGRVGQSGRASWWPRSPPRRSTSAARSLPSAPSSCCAASRPWPCASTATRDRARAAPARLEDSPVPRAVFYPGLPSHPQAAVAARQAAGRRRPAGPGPGRPRRGGGLHRRPDGAPADGVPGQRLHHGRPPALDHPPAALVSGAGGGRHRRGPGAHLGRPGGRGGSGLGTGDGAGRGGRRRRSGLNPAAGAGHRHRDPESTPRRLVRRPRDARRGGAVGDHDRRQVHGRPDHHRRGGGPHRHAPAADPGLGVPGSHAVRVGAGRPARALRPPDDPGRPRGAQPGRRLPGPGLLQRLQRGLVHQRPVAAGGQHRRVHPRPDAPPVARRARRPADPAGPVLRPAPQ